MSLEAQLLEQLGGGGGGYKKNEWKKKKRKVHQREEEERLEVFEVAKPILKNESLNVDSMSFKSSYSCAKIPKLKHGCFMKSSEWAPDGSVLLTNCEDNVIRLFNLPNQDSISTTNWQDLQPSLSMSEGECIYDMSWYPKMSDQNTCCFVSSSRDHPIHLWDANSGKLRATYNAYDDVGPVTAYSLQFTKLGSDYLIAGYKSQIRIFDSSEAGESSDIRSTTIKIKNRKSGLAGIISCIDTSPTHKSVFGLGTFSSSLGVFDIRTPGKGIGTITGTAHSGAGITGLKFSKCGTYIYTAARKDGDIKIWDLRRLSGTDWDGKHTPLTTLQRDQPMTRKVPTNQRIGFDFDISGRYLYSGCHSGAIKVFDCSTSELVKTVQVANCAVNGVSTHPSLPIISLTTGERRFQLSTLCDQDDGLYSVSSGSETSSDSDSSSTTSSQSQEKQLPVDNTNTVTELVPPSLPSTDVPDQPINIQLSVCGDSIFGGDGAVPSTLEIWSGELVALEPTVVGNDDKKDVEETETAVKRPNIDQSEQASESPVPDVNTPTTEVLTPAVDTSLVDNSDSVMEDNTSVPAGSLVTSLDSNLPKQD